MLTVLLLVVAAVQVKGDLQQAYNCKLDTADEGQGWRKNFVIGEKAEGECQTYHRSEAQGWLFEAKEAVTYPHTGDRWLDHKKINYVLVMQVPSRADGRVHIENEKSVIGSHGVKIKFKAGHGKSFHYIIMVCTHK